LVNLALFYLKKVGVLHHNLTKVKKASQKDYDNFRKYFAFTCVDLIIFDGKSVLLTRRTRNPYKGYWHLPGSMVHKDETLQGAAKRSAKEELNLNVKIKKFVGVYESLNKFRHDVSHGFVVTISKGAIKTDYQSNDYGFFKKLPAKTLHHHKRMIRDAMKSRHK
jgi:ADP-ribose pyrophosphatase YjhB (NUDIX family)